MSRVARDIYRKRLRHYLILAAAQKALETAAYHFTRDTAFYSGKPHG